MRHLDNSGNWAVNSLESWRGGGELENDWELKDDKKLQNNEKLENDGGLGSRGGFCFIFQGPAYFSTDHGICGSVWRRPLTLEIQRLGDLGSEMEVGDFWEP